MADAPERIPLARPAISDGDLAASERALRSGRLVLGPENQRFETALAGRCGRAHGVCVTSGTTALELGLWALGVGPGDEVIVPAGGFPAAATAALRVGARPVAVDIRADTWNLDVETAADALGERTRALVAVDLFGVMNEAAELAALAGARELAIIDDAACSLGARDSRGVAGGGYGVLATLSFHPRKVITSGEGGALVCDDPALAQVLRELRNQGQAGRGRFVRVGSNARLGEPAAAVGASQMARLDDTLAERELLVTGYRERLGELRARERLVWQAHPEGARPAWQTFAVQLAAGIDRDAVMARLDAAGIEAAPATYSLDRVSSLAGLPGIAGRAFPVARALHERGLALPLYIGMRSAALDRVAEILARTIDEVAP